MTPGFQNYSSPHTPTSPGPSYHTPIPPHLTHNTPISPGPSHYTPTSQHQLSSPCNKSTMNKTPLQLHTLLGRLITTPKTSTKPPRHPTHPLRPTSLTYKSSLLKTNKAGGMKGFRDKGMVALKNARERKRVQAVNEAFSTLCKHLPQKHKKLSKVGLLQPLSLF